MTLVHVFDDARARGWEPFSLTRPTGELLFGCLRLGERAARLWSLELGGQVADPALAGFDEAGAAAVVAPDAIVTSTPRVFLSSRAVVDGPPVLPSGPGAARFVIRGATVGWRIPAGADHPPERAFLEPESWGGPADMETVPLEGTVLGWPWELVDQMPDRVAADIAWLFPRDDAHLPSGVDRLGTETISIDASAHIEPGVLLDSRSGPIRLNADVRVQAGTRLVGPAYIGAGTTLLGGPFEAVAIGPACKLRGEVEASVVLGYSNKAHDGFLGHAVLGRWVNLGALTTNSDLKNTYGSVRVALAAGTVDSGLSKVGVFLGDHVKTGIGTLLPTGGVIGAGTSVFIGGIAPGHLPAFSWVTSDGVQRFRIDRFLEIAAKVMARRDVSLDAGMSTLLSKAWDRSSPE